MGEVYVWSEMDAGNWRAQWGRESSILKQDERKKLLRDEVWSLDIEMQWRYIKIHAKNCWETQGELLGPENECQKRVGGILILRQDACKKVFRETREHVDIEARCPQKIGEKEASGRGES